MAELQKMAKLLRVYVHKQTKRTGIRWDWQHCIDKIFTKWLCDGPYRHHSGTG